ncbi:Bug family tripartite tricarboxylate transporter substrate binding protein [Roseomonas sp. BN140053]|uniref:Bug family tripartite tricarboxylate transporter substrate binding protein n=1 Tax=Roseomonas sp. BN140053 TaxID=3391898 RepID=UPI0039EB02CE
MRRRSLVAATAALPVLGHPALGQGSYPDRPVRIIVPFPPAGAADVLARIISGRLGERLGQPVVVENRGGSNGQIGAEAAARSRPDGYTLLLGQDTMFTANPWLYERPAVNVATELMPVASLVANQLVLAVNPRQPARNLAEFVELARRADPPLAYASLGTGSQHQFAMEMLMRRAGITLLHVPFRGGAPAATATVAGDTAALFAGASSLPLIREGQLRGLAVTGRRRAANFPELPTVAETYPGYELTIWLGLFAPAGVPTPVVERLRDAANAVLGEPEIRARLETGGGLEPLVTTQAEFAALIQADYEKYGALIRDIGIRVE